MKNIAMALAVFISALVAVPADGFTTSSLPAKQESTLDNFENDLNQKGCHRRIPRDYFRGPTGPTGPAGSGGTSFNNYASAFNATGILQIGDNLIFDTPTAIQGVTYNSNTGEFTVNQNGVYQIAISSTSFQQDGGEFQFLVNGQAVGGLLQLVSPSGSLTIILNLSAGATIGLETTTGAVFSTTGIVSITINQIN